jgi:hypothetical protein
MFAFRQFRDGALVISMCYLPCWVPPGTLIVLATLVAQFEGDGDSRAQLQA